METQKSHSRDEIRKELEPVFEEFVDVVDQTVQEAEDLGDIDFESFEHLLDKTGDELKRRGCEIGLLGCEPEDDHLRIDGDHYYQCMDSQATYRSQWGECAFKRGLFRKKGEHNGATVSPLELRAGIVEGTWTPGCARTIGQYVQELPAHRGAELSELPYSTTSFKRLAGQLGESWQRESPQLQTMTAERLEVPEKAASLSVLVDRVSVLMREDDDYNWRMLWCGAVCLHDDEGETLQTLRYGAIPDKLDESLRRPMGKDVKAILDQRPDLDRIALGDGGADVCGFLDEEYPEFDRRIDIMHLLEKIAEAHRLWSKKRPTRWESDELLDKWKLDLLNDDEAIDSIEKSIQRWAEMRNMAEAQEAVDAALTYIDNHREQMRYASIRKRGLPVGSGAIEATCKNLVAVRMKRNGQSWSHPGAQAILNLRSLALSDRWEDGMDSLTSTYRASVEPLSAQAA